MDQPYEYSEEELRRRRRKKALRKKKRRIRKIKALIALGVMLLLVILILVGIIKGIKGIIHHFSKEPQVEASVNEIESTNPFYGEGESNPYEGNGSQPNRNDIDNSFSNIPYAVKNENYKTFAEEDVKAPYAVLLRVSDSSILAGREEDTVIFPASMTKVMTLIVAVENMPRIAETYTFQHDDIAPHIYAGASRAGFEEGEEVPVMDILYGLILPSGADAATAIANAVAGSESEFAKLMNAKCKEMGLKNTHFENASGLYHSSQVTTCAEMAMIMAYAMNNETCAKVLSTYQYTTTKTSYNPDGLLLTSTMYSRMYGNEVENVSIIGGKTGYTVEAGNCMVSCGEKNGEKYVCVTASSTNKWHCIYDSFAAYGKYLP